jgi:tetratricopeptide (TPR) repeat protein
LWRKRLDAAVEADCPALIVEVAARYLTEFPSDARAHAQYGQALGELRRVEQARAAFLRGLELADPEDRWTIETGMGRMYRKLGEFAQADEWFERAIRSRPDHATPYILQGCMHAARGDLPKAEALHRRACACTTGAIDEAYLNLGLVLRGQGRYEEAAACLEKALEIDEQYKAATDALRDVERTLEFLRQQASGMEHDP